MSLHFVTPFYAATNMYDAMIIMKQFEPRKVPYFSFTIHGIYRRWLLLGPMVGVISHIGKYLRFLDPHNKYFTHSNPLFYIDNLDRELSWTGLLFDYVLNVLPNAITTLHLSLKIYESKKVPYSSKWILGMILASTGFVVMQNRVLYYLYHTKEKKKSISKRKEWTRAWHWNALLIHLIRHYTFMKFADLLCDEYKIRVLYK